MLFGGGSIFGLLERIQPHKKKDEISKSSIIEEELILDEELEKNIQKGTVQGCPYITTQIEDHYLEMLLDSRAEVSAITETLEVKLILEGGPLPTLPLSGLSIYNAIGQKPTKVSKQVLIPITKEKHNPVPVYRGTTTQRKWDTKKRLFENIMSEITFRKARIDLKHKGRKLFDSILK